MNTATKQPPHDRRARTRKEIKQLIAERNSVLSQYYNLASQAEQDTGDDHETLLEMLQEFCQDLVDYMATGHFEIYRRIEEGDERRDDITQLATEIYDKIINTTRVAIDFNDLYDASRDFDKSILKDLSKHLTVLGEQLATRIDLEDRFINTLILSSPSSKADSPIANV